MNENDKKIILGTGSYDNVKSGNTVSITGDGEMLGDTLVLLIKS